MRWFERFVPGWPLRLGAAAVIGMGAAAVAPFPVARALPPITVANLPAPVVVATPADIYGPLFRAVQLGRLFADGKSFADAVPRREPGASCSPTSPCP
jgi:alpha,alpha-trehalase